MKIGLLKRFCYCRRRGQVKRKNRHSINNLTLTIHTTQIYIYVYIATVYISLSLRCTCVWLQIRCEQSICFIFVMIECDLLNASKIDERQKEGRKKERKKLKKPNLIFECYDVKCVSVCVRNLMCSKCVRVLLISLLYLTAINKVNSAKNEIR